MKSSNNSANRSPFYKTEQEWRSKLAGISNGLLLFAFLSGLAIYVFPLNIFIQLNVLIHTIAGILMMVPVGIYTYKHWQKRRGGNLSHYQILGYALLAFFVFNAITGFYLTWQGLFSDRISYDFSTLHLVSGIIVGIFIALHLLTLVFRKMGTEAIKKGLRSAQKYHLNTMLVVTFILFVITGAWTGLYQQEKLITAFDEAYDWEYGEDRPFAPSLAQLNDAGRQERMTFQVMNVLSSDQNTSLSNKLAELEGEPIGFITKIRDQLGDLNLSNEQAKKIEAILQKALIEIKENGAIEPEMLGQSATCGTAGCHKQIYEEWLPSAHRYSALDGLFQEVQTIMAEETSPEATRYCAGCHDPISLLSGAKNSGSITLSTEGTNEGSSCLVCHSIVQADVQGNGNYTIKMPERYAFETMHDSPSAKLASDFLIRTVPQQHVTTYSRPLYKTEEFCAACHKQYIDTEINTDIGKVQGQNQYDSWKNSRWYHEDERDRTIGCRECHMPLVSSFDPARGDVVDYNRTDDDEKHRSHRSLASNQYVPILHGLEGAEEHVRLTEKWLRGEIDIPEIADKWTDGPVVRIEIVPPAEVIPGETANFKVVLTNNKTGHDFPTGPLDMIESWIEFTIEDEAGNELYHAGNLDETNRVEGGAMFRADAFDRGGELIDRHNLWDLVGANYKRSLYPGMTDVVSMEFQCPSIARGRVREDSGRNIPGHRQSDAAFKIPTNLVGQELTVIAKLWYRKANPEFMEAVYGTDTEMVAPISLIGETTTTITVSATQ